MYTEEECKAYMDVVNRNRMDGLLQIYRFAKDPLKHVAYIHKLVVPTEARVSTILDAGCGTGQFLFLLSQLRVARQYIGINKFACQFPPNKDGLGINLHVGDITKMEAFGTATAGNRRPDVIYCNYTIGHLNTSELYEAMFNFSHYTPMKGRMGIYDLASADARCDSVLGYTLHEPDYVCDTAESVGFRVVRADVFNMDCYRLAPRFKRIVTKEQLRDLKAVTRPVLYVFEKP